MISLRINVSKIEKARLFKGEKGTYLDAMLIATPNSKYDQYMIVQSVSKEERDKGVKGPIIGGGKDIGARVSRPEPAPTPATAIEPEDDLPF